MATGRPTANAQSPGATHSSKVARQSVSQGFICEMTIKRANTCDQTGIEDCSSRSSMMRCLGLVWRACVPCLPKLVLF